MVIDVTTGPAAEAAVVHDGSAISTIDITPPARMAAPPDAVAPPASPTLATDGCIATATVATTSADAATLALASTAASAPLQPTNQPPTQPTVPSTTRMVQHTLEGLLQQLRCLLPPHVLSLLWQHAEDPVAAFRAVAQGHGLRRLPLSLPPCPRLVLDAVSTISWLLGTSAERTRELMQLPDVTDLASLIADLDWQSRVRALEWCLDQFECALCGSVPESEVHQANQILAELVGSSWCCNHVKGSESYQRFQSVGGVKSVKVTFGGALDGYFPCSAVVVDNDPREWRDSDQFCVIRWPELAAGGVPRAIELLTALRGEIVQGAFVPEIVQLARVLANRDVAHLDDSYCLEAFNHVPPVLPRPKAYHRLALVLDIDQTLLSVCERTPATAGLELWKPPKRISCWLPGRRSSGGGGGGSSSGRHGARGRGGRGERRHPAPMATKDCSRTCIPSSATPPSPTTPASQPTLISEEPNTMLRPGLVQLIKGVAPYFDIFIATAATGPHPFKTVHLMQTLCGNAWDHNFVRCVDRDEFESQGLHEKSLDVVVGSERRRYAIVIDDKPDAWCDADQEHIIGVRPFRFTAHQSKREQRQILAETRRIQKTLLGVARHYQRQHGSFSVPEALPKYTPKK
eukprot:m.59523 g.59523  ORF g.59523 m.59523 type:complete len:631 (+) comp12995_c0_seq2:150-2042(+)